MAPVNCGNFETWKNSNFEVNLKLTKRCENTTANQSPENIRHGHGARGMNDNNFTFECHLCGKTYDEMTMFQDHMVSHSSRPNDSKVTWISDRRAKYNPLGKCIPSGRPHMCETCGKRFSLLENLHRHQLIHSNDRPFKCTHCNKHFRLSQHLKEHIRIHTGEKPFKCEVCGHAFCQISNLKSHMKTHTKEKSFSCDVCGKGFRRSFTLKQHKLIHAKKLFKGIECAKAFGHKYIENEPGNCRTEKMAAQEENMEQPITTETKVKVAEPSFEPSIRGSPVPPPPLLPTPAWGSASRGFFETKPEDVDSEHGRWPELNALAQLADQHRLQPNPSSVTDENNNVGDKTTKPNPSDYKWKRDLSREWIGDERLKQPEPSSPQDNSPVSVTSAHNSPVSVTSSNLSGDMSATSGGNNDHKSDDALKCWLDAQRNNSFSNLFGFSSGIPPTRSATLMGYNPLALVPMVEWQPVITGWRSMLDGSLYAATE